MVDSISPDVKEGWSGPGRCDSKIVPMPPEDDGLHIDLTKRGMYEWWYFDAHLEGGYTIVAFFYAANANPGNAGKTGVELTLLRPDGRKTQKFIRYPRSAFMASKEKADVKIGNNTLTSDYSAGSLPVYQIHLDEPELGIGFDLTYANTVHGWKPGSGFSHFANQGYFAWVVPIPRAEVRGMIRDGDKTIPVTGVGYHDHNWLNFPFQMMIEYWMWGRVYSKNFTVSYAYIRCNPKVNNHVVKVLMLAQKENVILSTGEYDLQKEDFEFSPMAGHQYPKSLTFTVPGKLEMNLNVQRVLEAVNMLMNFNPILRFLAKYLLRLKPGYFRLLSDFTVKVTQGGVTSEETGTTLHEIVAFKEIK
jgi:predicted secreted hydrolase